MNDKDLDYINKLLDRLNKLPNVLDLRIKITWEKISEDEYKKLFETYKELDELLNDLLAFINVKFPNRDDLIFKWNKIDFDPKIAGMKVKTNSRELIVQNWNVGLSDFKYLMENIKREILILLDNPIEKIQLKNDNPSTVISNSNIFYDKVISSEIKSISNQPIDDIALKTFKWQKWGIYISTIIAILGIVLAMIYS